MDSTDATDTKQATHRAVYTKVINTLDDVADGLGFHVNDPSNCRYLLAINAARAAVMEDEQYDEDHVETKFETLESVIYERASEYHEMAQEMAQELKEETKKTKKPRVDSKE